MHQWGDPYVSDTTWQSLKVGDRVRVKSTLPPFSGRIGTLEQITETGDYLVDFGDGLKCGYDGDMLVKVPDARALTQTQARTIPVSEDMKRMFEKEQEE